MNSSWKSFKDRNVRLITLIIAGVFLAAIIVNIGNEDFIRDFLANLAVELLVAFVVIAGLEAIIRRSMEQPTQPSSTTSTSDEEQSERE